jgi:hypothetical protein
MRTVIVQLVIKTAEFPGIGRLIAAFTGTDTGPYPEPGASSLQPSSHSFKIHLDVTIPSKPRSSGWTLSFRGFRQKSMSVYVLCSASQMHGRVFILDLVILIILGEEYTVCI